MATATLSDFGATIPGAKKHLAEQRAENNSDTPKRRRRKTSVCDRFGLYYIRGTVIGKKPVVLCKKSNKRIPLLCFDNVETAQKWWNENTPRIAFLDTAKEEAAEKLFSELWSNVREMLSVNERDLRNKNNRPRLGEDHRQGRDETPETFMGKWRPRGVQFGNWQDNRTECLNLASDALQDLCDVIEYSTSEMFLGGRVALAFGSRGKGKASAHYEPVQDVINLTKTRGSGSLAHEWFHALQDFGGTLERSINFGRWTDLINGLKQLGVYRRSVVADQTRSKKYFSTRIELEARCFEAWVRSKVDNDYLANIVSVGAFQNPESYPYPLESEMAEIDRLFTEFFQL